jgi:hypothetical protein
MLSFTSTAAPVGLATVSRLTKPRFGSSGEGTGLLAPATRLPNEALIVGAAGEPGAVVVVVVGAGAVVDVGAAVVEGGRVAGGVADRGQVGAGSSARVGRVVRGPCDAVGGVVGGAGIVTTLVLPRGRAVGAGLAGAHRRSATRSVSSALRDATAPRRTPASSVHPDPSAWSDAAVGVLGSSLA